MKNKEQKRQEAAERQAEHDSLSISQKIQKCLDRGSNTSKEFKRLSRILQKEFEALVQIEKDKERAAQKKSKKSA
jgi:paraquat-inducible protein B